MFCASVAYPVTEGARFDFDYFATKHAPLFAQYLGANCVRFEVHRPLAQPGAPAPEFLGAAYFWVSSRAEFGATLQKHGQVIYADIPQFTDIQPVRQWSEVLSGKTRESQT